MSTTVTCPHCQGKLRLRSTAAPRVRCHLCGKGFDNPASTVVPVTMLNRPLVAAQAVRGDVRLPAAEFRPAVAPAPAAAAVVESAPAPAAAGEPFATSATLEPATEPQSAAIAPPAAATVAARHAHSGRSAAARRRLRSRRKTRFGLRDTLIAGGVLVVIVAAVVGGTYLVLRDGHAPQRVAAADDVTPPAEDAGPTFVPILPPPPTDQLPARLVGVWELRADEDRAGTMEFRADGTATFVGALGGTKTAPEWFRWRLAAEAGEELTIRLDVPSGDTSFHLDLVLTSPDALTATRLTTQNSELPHCNRFVRRAEGKVEFPPHPPTP